ncbi:MAG: V-type ATP synthase subunit E [Aminivibrio sp.]|jgi:V/A-type H+-transporting ATPase subunit E|nr:ATPase [Synergistaceae bacterium]
MTESMVGEDRGYKVRNPEKLASLKNLLLKKADDEQEAILESARQEAAAWLEEQNAALDRMVEQIHAEAVKRAEEISKRQIAGAETTRTKERLRLQNVLLDEAVELLQKELVALRGGPEYFPVLAGLALEGASRLPAGSEVKLQLAREDAQLGEALTARLKDFRPDLTFTFNAEAAPILGGVWLSASDGSWRAPADWREVISGMKDALAERVLAIL